MGINTWLEKHKDDDDWVDKDVANLLSGRTDSQAAAKLWKAIARGEAGIVETLMWAKVVAKRITGDLIEADHQKSSDRERAALLAIGFYGRVDDYREAKEYMSIISSFHPLGEGGEELPNARLTGKQWLKCMRAAGHFEETDDKTAVNRINEWRTELGIE